MADVAPISAPATPLARVSAGHQLFRCRLGAGVAHPLVHVGARGAPPRDAWHLSRQPAEDYENLDFVKTRTGTIWDRPRHSNGLEFQFVCGIHPNKKRKCNALGSALAVLQLNRLATSGVVTIDCTKF